MTVGLLGLNLLFGGTLHPAFAWDTFSQIVHWGALLSLLPAVGISALAGWMRQSHSIAPVRRAPFMSN